jgi:hypothetical protein
MDLAHLIPSYQPLPFPVPIWLMQLLLVLGFFLHALPMNVVLGGGFLCAILFWLGRKTKTSYQYRAAKAFAISLPLFISFAVTQGIVPLLFLQLLYGPAFYTSSILLAVPWLSVLAVIMVSYYISYIVIYRVLQVDYNAKSALKAALLLAVMSIGFAAVGYMFSNNMTLMLTPEKWLAMYKSSPRGLNLNTADVQLLPRYLHFFIASIAVAGMTLGCFGLYLVKREQEFSKWLIKLGSKIFLGATLVQIPVGLWYLKALPPEFTAAFLGSNTYATAVFGLSMALTLLAILTSAIASSSGSKGPFITALVTNALLILAMIVNRDQLRHFYLSPHIKPELVPVSTQWDLLAIFLVSAVALIIYLVWLCRLVWSGFHPKTTEPLTSA